MTNGIEAMLILEVKTVSSELLVPCNKNYLMTGNYSGQQLLDLTTNSSETLVIDFND